MRHAVFTVGHSNQSTGELLGLLARHGIELLVDARSQPASRHAPHFARKALERAVREAPMQYLFLGGSLGGRPAERSCYDNAGRVLYDRVEEQDFYRTGIEELLAAIERQRVCLLCSEEDPLRCHRRLLVGRTLARRGVEVRHLRRDGRVEAEEEVQARFERASPRSRQLGLWGSGG